MTDTSIFEFYYAHGNLLFTYYFDFKVICQIFYCIYRHCTCVILTNIGQPRLIHWNITHNFQVFSHERILMAVSHDYNLVRYKVGLDQTNHLLCHRICLRTARYDDLRVWLLRPHERRHQLGHGHGNLAEAFAVGRQHLLRPRAIFRAIQKRR